MLKTLNAPTTTILAPVQGAGRQRRPVWARTPSRRDGVDEDERDDEGAANCRAGGGAALVMTQIAPLDTPTRTGGCNLCGGRHGLTVPQASGGAVHLWSCCAPTQHGGGRVPTLLESDRKTDKRRIFSVGLSRPRFTPASSPQRCTARCTRRGDTTVRLIPRSSARAAAALETPRGAATPARSPASGLPDHRRAARDSSNIPPVDLHERFDPKDIRAAAWRAAARTASCPTATRCPGIGRGAAAELLRVRLRTRSSSEPRGIQARGACGRGGHDGSGRAQLDQIVQTPSPALPVHQPMALAALSARLAYRSAVRRWFALPLDYSVPQIRGANRLPSHPLA